MEKESVRKKPLILYVLKILETNSDETHPYKQTKIAELISGQMECDRKTVGRNIKFLTEMGYPIKKTNGGFYMDKKHFSVEESALILRAVEQSPDIDEEKKADIAERLSTVLNRIYR